MSNDREDSRLGMGRPITRRDFLDGVAVSIAASAVSGCSPAGAPTGRSAQSPDPPRRLGDRGQHPGSNAVAHALRDGSFWANAGAARDTGEHYDLVVVGGGISGLAAAVQYRQQAGANARILIIENHDDFGGHAKRNEFLTASGRVVVGYGGSQSLQSPSFFSPAVKAMIQHLDLDLSRFGSEFFDRNWGERHKLGTAHFFAREAFGRDALVRPVGKTSEWLKQAPLNPRAREDLVALLDSPRDYLPGLSRSQRRARLASMSYQRFLTEIVGADPQVAQFYQDSTTAYFGVGIDATSALDACANGNPGFASMDLGPLADPAMSPSGRLAYTDPDPYIYHFPDGNHGLARALLRKLTPAALPADSMEALVTTPVDYARLDEPSSHVRLRLQSTVVRVQHRGDPAKASAVDVQYVRQGALKSVTAGHVVLACWHRVIPHIFPELPAPQISALNDQRKVPLIYTNVLLRNWSALERLGLESIRTPGHFWRGVEIDFPVSMGSYRFPEKSSEPMLLHLSAIPTSPGLSPREQASAGRARIASLTFEELERSIRDLLGRCLGAGGFDPARDIEGLCVNRWAHGYAYEYMRPWDTQWPSGPLPVEAARRPLGRVAIANSDSGAYAYAHSAMDQAIRAVRELLGTPAGAPAHAERPGPPVELFDRVP